MLLLRHRLCLVLLIALVAWVSLGAQFLVSLDKHPELGIAGVAWRLLRFFTILTNLLVAATFTHAALTRQMPGPIWSTGLTLWIVIVGVVNYALLAQVLQGLEFWADIGLHALVPGLVLLWWLTAADRQGLRISSALLWLIWPGVYVIYALGRGGIDGTYPYFFTDPTRLGWAGVALWSLALCAVFFVGEVGLIRLARILPDAAAAAKSGLARH
ncbi:Pr6Pr family membrane protein [Pseudooceanicola sp.]|uniref:Pr6Pr family membrane protein n=1 Tax=Pseudooceanicola sp. TaxID=1914328 RepID=UPI00261BDFDA|nr:Pr6Pr family membrane protein [Pseudooceanicola sp.]MDF1856050.1 Pr6Pr family membrane protein [Pseudooceanicola sp.]